MTAVHLEAATIDCDGAAMVGVLHRPQSAQHIGVIILVGGPQYRIGAHRSYVRMARAFSEAGFACLRFDYRGIGDSQGTQQGFENVGADIDAAVAWMRETMPELKTIVLWGLCEAATSILLLAAEREAVHGAVIANPWMGQEGPAARTQKRHYYRRRLLSGIFWRRLLRGDVHLLAALSDMLNTSRSAQQTEQSETALSDRVVSGARALEDRPLLLLESGDDPSMAAFLSCCHKAGLSTPPKTTHRQIPGADHSFSRTAWLDQAIAETLHFLARF